jgi:hypothetical protein
MKSYIFELLVHHVSISEKEHYQSSEGNGDVGECNDVVE